ncbi:hypothetical protein GCM10018965_004120 [Nonomuraea roseola]
MRTSERPHPAVNPSDRIFSPKTVAAWHTADETLVASITRRHGNGAPVQGMRLDTL